MRAAAEQIARWREHPAQMVRELFKTEPDPAQEEALQMFPRTRRICLKACTGSGKTAVLAWIAWNFLLTRPHPIVGATSISGDNLKANLWTELARWRNKTPLLQETFEQTKTLVYAKDHPETWKIEARTWAKDADASQIGNALRGLHSEYIMWLLDETGDYPDAIMPICEAIFSGSPKEAHIVQAGNPVKLGGPLYRATLNKDLWHVIEITADPDDPKRTPRVSVEHAREQIRLYGKDNPWVLVNIFGKFPPSSFNSLIGPDEVTAAMKRLYRAHDIGEAARVLGIDVARYGDDSSVIAPRQGIQMFPLKKFRNLNSTQGAGQTNRFWNEWRADAAFIDMSGGFGAGWYDQLQNLGKAPIGVEFAGAAHDPNRYFNKRTEMAFDFVEWIKMGGALCEDADMLKALVETTYTFKGDKLLLEPKEMVKIKMNGKSPDEMDAGMLTFAEPVALTKNAGPISRAAASDNYDPYRSLGSENQRGYAAGDYDPYR